MGPDYISRCDGADYISRCDGPLITLVDVMGH